MHNIETATLPGTQIIIVPHDGNPAEKEVNQRFLEDNYWEVIVLSDGTNPQFPHLMWRILLVTPRPNLTMQPYTEDDYTVVPVDGDTIIKRAETLIGEIPSTQGNWACSGLKLHLSSKRGEQEAFFSCAPLPTEPPAGTVFQ